MAWNSQLDDRRVVNNGVKFDDSGSFVHLEDKKFEAGVAVTKAKSTLARRDADAERAIRGNKVAETRFDGRGLTRN